MERPVTGFENGNRRSNLTKKQFTALIDADVVAYVAAAQALDDEWADEGGSVVHTERACQSAISEAKRWADAAGCSDLILCFSSKRGLNYRKIICPTYKAGRREKPEAYGDVVAALESTYDVLRIEGLEADDVLGIKATDDSIPNPVIVTIDKDLQTIPGLLFNPRKTRGRPWRINRSAADLYWMTQALMGDATDGYKGAPGIGPKTATRLLSGAATVDDLWAIVEQTYRDKGLPITEALLNTRMARILRAEDFDAEDNTVRLWGPNRFTTEWMALPE